MRLLVLGASGGVGRHVAAQAVEAGHAVTALVRAETPWKAPEGVRVLRGDVLDARALDGALEGADAVLSSLGMKRVNPANPWSPLASPADFNSRSAEAVVAAMKRAGVGRVVAVSAAGVGDSARAMNLLMRVLVARSNVGVAYRDLAVMERVYAESGLDWLTPRPTRLTDGPRTNRVKTVTAFGSFDAIARADVAAWMLARLDDPRWTDRSPQITGV